MTPELEALKSQYEAVEGFTSWSDFPELWDIGDPFGVKASYIVDNDPSISDAERGNYQRLQGKPYDEIVPLNRQPGLNVGEGKELFQPTEDEEGEESELEDEEGTTDSDELQA